MESPCPPEEHGRSHTTMLADSSVATRLPAKDLARARLCVTDGRRSGWLRARARGTLLSCATRDDARIRRPRHFATILDRGRQHRVACGSVRVHSKALNRRSVVGSAVSEFQIELPRCPIVRALSLADDRATVVNERASHPVPRLPAHFATTESRTAATVGPRSTGLTPPTCSDSRSDKARREPPPPRAPHE